MMQRAIDNRERENNRSNPEKKSSKPQKSIKSSQKPKTTRNSVEAPKDELKDPNLGFIARSRRTGSKSELGNTVKIRFWRAIWANFRFQRKSGD